MTGRQWMAAAVFVGLLTAWLARYEVVPANDTATPYAWRLDRWTGETTFYRGPARVMPKE